MQFYGDIQKVLRISFYFIFRGMKCRKWSLSAFHTLESDPCWGFKSKIGPFLHFIPWKVNRNSRTFSRNRAQNQSYSMAHESRAYGVRIYEKDGVHKSYLYKIQNCVKEKIPSFILTLIPVYV